MLSLSQASADIFVPDGAPLELALSRTTHLGVGAHADDLEILAAHGILAGFRDPSHWFCGVIASDGRGSSRGPQYSQLTESEFCEVRRQEQRKAAYLGEYAAQLQLDFTSSALRQAGGPGQTALVFDLEQVLRATQPEVVYTHNLADAHTTHVAVALALIEACKRLEPELRPSRVWGCEVWRDLDWLSEADRVRLLLPDRPHILSGLLSVFDSQIAGNKRYDLATLGRRQAHATFDASDAADSGGGLTLAMDLRPVIDGADPLVYLDGLIERFRGDVLARLRASR